MFSSNSAIGKAKELGASWVGLLCLGDCSWLADDKFSPHHHRHQPEITPTVLRQEPVRGDMLSWRLNAKSIQLHHPPLHLTFQRTCISSLYCQTFSTCYFASVPHVSSSSVLGGWTERNGSTKVDAKRGMRVRLRPLDSHTLLASLLNFYLCDDSEQE